MSEAIGEVDIVIRAKVDQLARDLADVRRRMEEVDRNGSTALQKITARVSALPGPLGAATARTSSLAGSFGALGAAGAAAAVTLTVLTVGAMRAIREFREAQTVMLTTEAVVKATGMAAGRTAEQIGDMAEEIGYTTLASDLQAQSAANLILTFKSIAGVDFDRTLKAAQDLAAVGFGSITGSALQLAKALEEPTIGLTMLRRAGVSFSAAQKQQINDMIATGQRAEAMRLILKQVEAQVGGAGGAQAAGLAGAFHLLSEATGNWFEQIGQKLDKVLGLTGHLRAMGEAARAAADRMKEMDTDEGQLAYWKRVLELSKTAQSKMFMPGQGAISSDRAAALAREKIALLQSGAADRAAARATEEKTAADKSAAVEAERRAGVYEGLVIQLRRETDLLQRGALAREIDEQQRKAEVGVIRGQADARTDLQKKYADEIAALVTQQYHIKNGASLMQQRISLLGPLASAEEHAAAKAREVADAVREGMRVRREERAIIIERARLEAAERGISERAALGVASAMELEKQKLAELDLVTRTYNLTAAQQAGALAALDAKYRQVAESAAVAASKFPELTRAGIDATNMMRQFDTLAVSAVDRLSSSLADVVMGTKDFGTAMREVAASVVQDLAKMIIKAQLYQLIMSAMGFFSGSGSGSFFDVGSATSFGAHSGAIVGSEASFTRRVPAAYFAHAPRLHSGGMIGAGEVPIIAKRGEGVFTQGQMRALGLMAGGTSPGPASSGGGAPINISLGGTSINIAGDARAAEIDRLKADMAERDRRLPEIIVKTVRDQRARRAL